MKILIIEDEPFARAELKRLIKETGREFEVLAEIDTVEESIAWLKSHRQPDLVFLDIQLADGISFDIFRHIHMASPVIFTTAYDEYAIKAFQLNSIDYLLKPVSLEALEQAFKKLDEMQSNLGTGKSPISQDQLEGLLSFSRKNYKSRILLKLGDQLKSVEINTVAYFYAEEDVVFAILKDKSRFIVDYTLNQLENELNPDEFYRITRGCLTHINSVKKVSKYFNSRLIVELEPPAAEKQLVSRVNVPGFLKWLDR